MAHGPLFVIIAGVAEDCVAGLASGCYSCQKSFTLKRLYHLKRKKKNRGPLVLYRSPEC